MENQLKLVVKRRNGDDAPESKRCHERIEKFKREWFVRFEEILHRAETGPMWMQNENVAERVAENLHRLDGEAYRLDAYTIMSNHVHALFKPYLSETELRETRDETGHLAFIGEHPGLACIMQALKGRSA